MLLKSGVSIAGLHPCMRRALIVCERVFKAHGQEFVITSGLDGCHSAGSLHYYGFAIDAQTRHLKDDKERFNACEEIQMQLQGFDVVLEKTHIHIENEKVFNRFVER